MRTAPFVLAVILASSAAFAQNAKVPKPGPSPTSGSDAGPFSGLPDNTPAPPPVLVGSSTSEAQASATIDAATGLQLRSTETVQQATEQDLDRAEREHQRQAEQMMRSASPIEGAFNGQTDERSR